MKSNGTSDDLQSEMSCVRRNLGAHTEQIIEEAREQLNWQHYIAKYPWAALGVAAAAGYLLVPSRTHFQKVNCPEGEQAGRCASVSNASTSSGNASAMSSAVAGVLGSVMAMMAAAAAREGFAAVSKMASEWWESNQNGSSAASNAPRTKGDPVMISMNENSTNKLRQELWTEFLKDREIVEKEVVKRPGMALFAALCVGILIGIGVKR